MPLDEASLKDKTLCMGIKVKARVWNKAGGHLASNAWRSRLQ
jgi:hypothetical protein